MDRLKDGNEIKDKEILFEEAAVLAGTMLMGSGISGSRPNAHDSTVGLPALVQKIADYRDAFYQQLIQRVKGQHAQRLKRESAALKQPFGGAQAALQSLPGPAQGRTIAARAPGPAFYADGIRRGRPAQVRVVPVASARMLCDMQCRLTAGHREIDHGRLEPVVKLLGEIENIMHRAIECGAMVDPWNILGFGGQFGLFPSPENSIHDYRVDELMNLMSDIFALYIRAGKEAAALGKTRSKPRWPGSSCA